MLVQFAAPRVIGLMRLAAIALWLGLAACSSGGKPTPEFKKISLEKKNQLEIELFNVYAVRNELSAGSENEGPERTRIINRLISEGSELAWLASHFYDFQRLSPIVTDETDAAWGRLRDLAEAGDAGAQCLFWAASYDMAIMRRNPMSAEDIDQRVDRYLSEAAKGNFPYCLAQWALKYKSKDATSRFQYVLQAAKMGCAECQVVLSVFYRSGDGVAKDHVKAVYWMTEANRLVSSPSYQSRLSRIIFLLNIE